MPAVTVNISPAELFENLDDEELIDEMAERGYVVRDKAELLAIWEEFRRRGDAPECLRNYLYEMTGRSL